MGNIFLQAQGSRPSSPPLDPGVQAPALFPQTQASRIQPSSLRPSRPTWSLSILPGPTSPGSRPHPHLGGPQLSLLALLALLLVFVLRRGVLVREGHCAGERVEAQAVEQTHPAAELAVAGLRGRAQLQVEGTTRAELHLELLAALIVHEELHELQGEQPDGGRAAQLRPLAPPGVSSPVAIPTGTPSLE